MLIAGMCSILAGVTLPLLVLVLGFTLNNFIDYDVTLTLTGGNFSNDDYFCNISTQTNLLEYLTSSDPVDMLRSETATYTYYTLGIALLFFLSASVSRFLWSVSATRQARKMRLDYLKSILTRYIGWFDINSSAELPTHLSE